MVVAAPTPTARFAAPVARLQEIRARFGVADPATPSADPATGTDFAALLASMDPAGRLGDAQLGALKGTSPTTAGPGGTTGRAVVDIAMEYQGVPYVWGGSDPSKGLDCSGLVQKAFGRLGMDLPRVSRDQATQGVAVASLDQARPGDLIAFGRPVDHIAIYMGDGKIIHSPRSGDVVKIAEIHRTPTAIRRLVPDSASAVTPGAGSGTAGPTGVAGTVPIAQSTPALAQYSSLFASAGATHGISANLLAAVAKVESGGNANALSSAGARGLMQFMPGTARSMGIDPMDPAQAIDGAARLLTRLRDMFGSTQLALAAYNAGEGAVRRAGGIPPYAETQAYVSKVMALLGGTA